MTSKDELRVAILEKIPCIDSYCDGHGTTIDGDIANNPQPAQCQFCYENRFPVADAILNLLEGEKQKAQVDTPEVQRLLAENKRLIEAGDALYERASYTGREFDGTHRLLSAAAHWLDVRGKNSGEYQATLNKEPNKGEDVDE